MDIKASVPFPALLIDDEQINFQMGSRTMKRSKETVPKEHNAEAENPFGFGVYRRKRTVVTRECSRVSATMTTDRRPERTDQDHSP